MERKCSGFGRCIALTAIGGGSAQGVPLGPAYIGGVRVKCSRSVAYELYRNLALELRVYRRSHLRNCTATGG
ncbi:MAG: hypothetical protein K0R61_518 [Microvirga sp.]|jgi:hypothetical protein|nr:hypothetical protein [Microvirga sp.]